jgi:hypothetical protein
MDSVPSDLRRDALVQPVGTVAAFGDLCHGGLSRTTWWWLFVVATVTNTLVILQWPVTSVVSANCAVYLFGMRGFTGDRAEVLGVGLYAGANLACLVVCRCLLQGRHPWWAPVACAGWLLSLLPMFRV